MSIECVTAVFTQQPTPDYIMTKSSVKEKVTPTKGAVQDSFVAKIADMTFEEAVLELESLVKQLESSETPLSSVISIYERASALHKHCEKQLSDAELKISKISFDKKDK